MSGPRAKIGQKSSGKSTSPATNVRVWSFGWGPSVFLFFVCLFLFFFSDPQIIPTSLSLSLKGNKRRETLVTRLKLMVRRGFLTITLFASILFGGLFVLNRRYVYFFALNFVFFFF